MDVRVGMNKHQRIDTFKLWWCRRALKVLWAARRSNQSILKESSPEYSLEGLMLKLKLQHFGHLVGTTDWFKIGNDVHEGCILSPCLFNFYAVYIMWDAG